MCSHVESGVDIAQLSKRKFSLSQCQDCAKDPAAKKSKVRSTLKKAARLADPAQRHIKRWICLACGHVACGTIHQEDMLVKDENSPAGHAWKHFLIKKHPLALQVSDTFVCWCFKCGMVIAHTSSSTPSQNTSSSNPQLATARSHDPLQEAADLVREKLSKRKGSMLEPVRCVLDTVRVVFDTATQFKFTDGFSVNPSKSLPCIGRKQSVRGLINLGNTCFLNAILQNLLALEVLRDHFCQQPQYGEGLLTASLKSLYMEVNSDGNEQLPMPRSKASGQTGKTHQPVEPSIIITCNPSSLFDAICAKAPRFNGYQQQDSHELLKHLLEGLILEERSAKIVLNADQDAMVVSNGGHKKLSSAPSSQPLVQNGHSAGSESSEEDGRIRRAEKASHSAAVAPTFLESVFGGQLSSTVQCCECRHASVVYETMLDLSLQIPTKQALKKRQALENQGSSPVYPGRSHKDTLYDAEGRNKADVTCMQGTSSNHASTVITRNHTFSSVFPSSQSEQDAVEASELSEVLHEPVSRLVHNPSPKGIADSLETCINGEISLKDNSAIGFRVSSCVQGVWIDSADSSDLTSDDKNAMDDVLVEANREDGLLPSATDILSPLNETEVDCNAGGKSSSDFTGFAIEWGYETFSRINEVKASGIVLPSNERGVDCNVGRKSSSDHVDFATKWRYEEKTGGLLPSNETEVDCKAGGERISDFTDFAYECGYGSSPRIYEADGESLSTSHFPREDEYESTSQSSEEAVSLPANKQKGKSNDNQVKANGLMKGPDFKVEGYERLIYQEDAMASLSLEACLTDFTKPEFLCGDDAWECANCSRAPEHKAHPWDLNEAVARGKVGCQDLCREEEESGSTINESNVVDHDVKESESMVDMFQPVISCAADLESGSDERGYQASTIGAQTMHEEVSTSTVRLVQAEKVPSGCTSSKTIPSLREELHSKHDHTTAKDCQGAQLVKRDATKQFLISKPPLVLTVHLKRFEQDGRGRLNKLGGHVAFSELLDLQPFLDPRFNDPLDQCLYRLVGIVEHKGMMGGGHYVAFVRGAHMGEETRKDVPWYYASDCSVCQTTLQDVLDREAYLLFYEKCGSSTKEER